MNKIFAIGFFITMLGIAQSPVLAAGGPTVYLPLGSAGEILILDATQDKPIGRITGLPAVHGLAGTPGWGFLVAGSFEEQTAGSAAIPAKPKGVSEDEHAAHHAKPSKSASANDTLSILSIVSIADRTVTRRIEVPGAVHHTAVVPGGRFAIATHPARDGVSIVDLSLGKAIAMVRTGPTPNYAVVSPDGKQVFVSNSGNDTISEIDTKHWTVRRSIKTGKSPEHMVLSSDGKALYLANAGDGSVSVISLTEGIVAETFKVGGDLHGIDLADNGQTIFVSGRDTDKLIAINLSTKKIESKPLAPSPYHLNTIKGTGKIYISSADENKLWVVDQKSLAVIREIFVPATGHQMVTVSN
ncbi:MAG: YncE family protein [Rhodospirillales bacterium]|nr:YncE family protein [Rhodospirillales bacterium]